MKIWPLILGAKYTTLGMLWIYSRLANLYQNLCIRGDNNTQNRFEIDFKVNGYSFRERNPAIFNFACLLHGGQPFTHDPFIPGNR